MLIETRHKGKWRGRTPHNRLVFIESEQNLTGALVDAKVTFTSAFSMQGDLTRVKVEPLPQSPDLAAVPMFHRGPAKPRD